MTHSRITLILATAFLQAQAWAQALDPVYLPLEVGNRWSYQWILEPPFAPPDTFRTGPYITSESISINDTTYYITAYPFSLADTLRADEEGRIWARVLDQDMLFFDFTLEEGETYMYQSPQEGSLNYQVSIERNITRVVEGERFENCIQLVFDDPVFVDDAQFFFFAPGVGIVYAQGGFGGYEELYLAEVGGRVVTSNEMHAEWPVEAPHLSVFPNPFRATTNLVIPNPYNQPLKVHVYDVLGREVARLLDGPCSGTPCVLHWGAQGMAGGRYVLHVERENQIQTTVLFLSR